MLAANVYCRLKAVPIQRSTCKYFTAPAEEQASNAVPSYEQMVGLADSRLIHYASLRLERCVYITHYFIRMMQAFCYVFLYRQTRNAFKMKVLRLQFYSFHSRFERVFLVDTHARCTVLSWLYSELRVFTISAFLTRFYMQSNGQTKTTTTEYIFDFSMYCRGTRKRKFRNKQSNFNSNASVTKLKPVNIITIFRYLMLCLYLLY